MDYLASGGVKMELCDLCNAWVRKGQIERYHYHEMIDTRQNEIYHATICEPCSEKFGLTFSDWVFARLNTKMEYKVHSLTSLNASLCQIKDKDKVRRIRDYLYEELFT